jgi:hypothetical protein
VRPAPLDGPKIDLERECQHPERTMTGPIDQRIGTFGEMFRQIADPPGVNLTNPVQIEDGPLTQGLGTQHNVMSTNAIEFTIDMRLGMTDTGDILTQVSAGYQNIDQGGADAMRKLFAEPPGGTEPEGAR